MAKGKREWENQFNRRSMLAPHFWLGLLAKKPTTALSTLLFLLVLAARARGETTVEAWVQRYSNVAESDDRTKRIVANSNGIIVAGYSDAGLTGQDMLIIKYSNGGMPMWTNRYNGSANDQDAVNAVAVDASGNVFVTGTSASSGTGIDFATIAYSNTGVPLWTNRYNGPAKNSDIANSVAVDSNGNVFVTGTSVGNTSGYDFATIKYSNTGVPLWTNRYNGPGNSSDTAYGLGVDGLGNVFVTGSSTGIGSGNDFTTIAYADAGAALWTNRFSEPGNSSDIANAIAVNSSGTVVVTGTSTGGGSGADFATIAYSTGGNPLWTNRYNGPGNSSDLGRAVTVNDSGNVFVTGSSTGSGSGYDFATIAYSREGLALWTNRYSAPGNFSDTANAVVAGSNGILLVTGSTDSESGSDYATIAYSGMGVPLWTNLYNGPAGDGSDSANAVAVDESDNVFVTGLSWSGSSFDAATIAYSSGGLDLWTNWYSGFGNGSDTANALAVDTIGNVFVTGDSAGSGAGRDIVTLKYSNAGLPLWTNRYNGLGNSFDEAEAVALDGNGNVFVTGTSASSGGGSDFVTIKYSNTGMPLWTNLYDGPANSGDSALAMGVDSRGDLLVVGNSTGIGTSDDFTTIKYSNNGLPLWTNRYDGLRQSADYVAAVAVGRNDIVVVTGYSVVDSTTLDIVTIAYSNTGIGLWTNRFNGPDPGVAASHAMTPDSSGNIFVTGQLYPAGSSSDFVTVAYSGAGTPLWTNLYDGPASGHDSADGLAVDSSGTVFVTGTSAGHLGKADITTIAYSNAGVPLWTNRYLGPGNSDDIARAVAVDGSNNVVVTGYSSNSSGDNDYITIKYSNAGVPLWTNRYNGPANGDDLPQWSPFSLAIGQNGDVFVTGASDGNYSKGTTYDFATVKYASTPQPFELTSSTHLPNGNFRFILSATSQLGYRIDASADLLSWTTLTNVFYSNSVIQFTDFEATNFLRRYYRAVWSP